MALGFTPVMESAESFAPGWIFFMAKVDYDNNYPTGGYELPPDLQLNQHFQTDSDVGPGSSIISVMIESRSGYQGEYNRSTQKIQVFSGGSEVGNGTDLSAITDITLEAKSYGWRNVGVVREQT